MDEEARNHLHEGDTYVVRWYYLITATGRTLKVSGTSTCLFTMGEVFLILSEIVNFEIVMLYTQSSHYYW